MSLSKAQLTKAAKMKHDGSTWNAVREAMGVKFSSGKFQKLMDAAGIDRPATRPSGRGKAKAAPKPVPKPKATKKAPAKAKANG